MDVKKRIKRLEAEVSSLRSQVDIVVDNDKRDAQSGREALASKDRASAASTAGRADGSPAKRKKSTAKKAPKKAAAKKKSTGKSPTKKPSPKKKPAKKAQSKTRSIG